MPLTPFHLGPATGPATFLKAAMPRSFSLGSFALVQVAIDLEVLGRLTEAHL